MEVYSYQFSIKCMSINNRLKKNIFFKSSWIHLIILFFHRKRVQMAAVPVDDDDDEEELSVDEENMISASEDEVKDTHSLLKPVLTFCLF